MRLLSFQTGNPAKTAPQAGPDAGFTLIELLVVIAIIAILAAMLLPALARSKAEGEGVKCLSNLHQLQVAWTSYMDDNHTYLVGNDPGTGTNPVEWVNGWLDWNTSDANTNTLLLTQGLLGPYTAQNPGVYKCPSDKIPAANGARVRSVSMNTYMGRTNQSTSYLRYSQLRAPAQLYVFLDEHPDSINDGCFSTLEPTDNWDDLPASYHVGACGFSFADGHSEIHKWLDATTDQPIMRDVWPGLVVSPPNDRDWHWVYQHNANQ